MDPELIAKFGDDLHRTLTARVPVVPLSGRGHPFTVRDAYHIQQHFVAQRLAHGDRVTGKKIGVTSLPVQQMLNVYQPDFGMLLASMEFPDGKAIPASILIQPRAEGRLPSSSNGTRAAPV